MVWAVHAVFIGVAILLVHCGVGSACRVYRCSYTVGALWCGQCMPCLSVYLYCWCIVVWAVHAVFIGVAILLVHCGVGSAYRVYRCSYTVGALWCGQCMPCLSVYLYCWCIVVWAVHAVFIGVAILLVHCGVGSAYRVYRCSYTVGALWCGQCMPCLSV